MSEGFYNSGGGFGATRTGGVEDGFGNFAVFADSVFYLAVFCHNSSSWFNA
jgi:hypothetical protein